MSSILQNAKKGLPKFVECDKESEYGVIHSISGPVITAEIMPGSQMGEIVRIGHDHFLGEIIQISGQTAKVQCFEETTGLHIGDPVLRTHQPLTVQLGPGLMNSIFDGVQKPLQRIAESSNSFVVPKGHEFPPLQTDKLWSFEPFMKLGMHIAGGDIFGKVVETELVTHFIPFPPGEMGTITFIAPAGDYTIKEYVLEVEFQGKTKEFTMMQIWPARQPRPVVDRIACDTPLFTGHRVFDTLFPMMQGGTCAIPGNQGGKHTVLQSICKFSNSDCVVYTGCGDRSGEMVEALMSLEQLTVFEKNQKQVPLMYRTSVVANTDHMQPAVRDAAMWTGITIAEYYRDMGLNVVVTADSIARWADALRDIGSHLGGMPQEGGYPAYLASRINTYFERAGKVTCLGSPSRKGSVAIFATISPVTDDWFTDPIVKPTLTEVQAFWALDRRLAQRKHFPSVNWSVSFSKYMQQLQPFYDEFDPEFIGIRTKLTEILSQGDDITELVQLVGVNSLEDKDRIIFDIAKIIKEDFLQQNLFTPYDKYCPFYKAVWMARNIVLFYEEAQRAISNNKLTWSTIKEKLQDTFYHLCCMKFEDPCNGQDKVVEKLTALNKEIRQQFLSLED